MPRIWLVLAIAVISGCTDEAAPDYDRCQRLKGESKFEEALAACESASRIKGSEAAQKATAELVEIKTAIIAGADQEALNALKQWDESADTPMKVQAATVFEVACKKGSQTACMGLGLRYLDGIGGSDMDYDKALPLLRHACDARLARACAAFGWMHFAGVGVKKDPNAAARLFKTACEADSPQGCEKLAAMYQTGAGGLPKDEKKGLELFRKACDAGRDFACWGAASAYWYGQGTTPNYELAVQLTKKSCDGDYGAGCALLAIAHSQGRGASKDDVLAAKMAQKACDLNNANGCGLLASYIMDAKGVKPDVDRAFALISKACELDSGPACYQVADWMRNGWGTTLNALGANDMFAKACELKDASACKELRLPVPMSARSPRL